MIFNMTSGGAALNFNVVGSTSVPSNPKENTIWINTDTEVSGYIFSNKDPNLLDVENWATNIGVVGGTKTLGVGSITLTANNDICYTSSGSELAHIRCTQGKTYVIQWDYSGTGNTNSVQLYPNMDTTKGVWAYADAGKLEYTVTDSVTYFGFTFTVSANNTATYSNIRITEKELAFDTGTVWIHTGLSSPVKFNALKKNGIMVYPVSVKQYVGGAWVSKIAKSYQGGQWVDWVTFLIQQGADNTTVTGGWKAQAKALSGHEAYAPTATNNGDHLTLTLPIVSKWRGGIYIANSKLDLTDIKTITVVGSGSVGNSSGASVGLAIWSSIGSYIFDNNPAKVAMDSSGKYSLDVSTFTGEYIVGFYLASGSTSTIQIYDLYYSY